MGWAAGGPSNSGRREYNASRPFGASPVQKKKADLLCILERSILTT
jgi:hypothetical protein